MWVLVFTTLLADADPERCENGYDTMVVLERPAQLGVRCCSQRLDNVACFSQCGVEIPPPMLDAMITTPRQLTPIQQLMTRPVL